MFARAANKFVAVAFMKAVLPRSVAVAAAMLVLLNLRWNAATKSAAPRTTEWLQPPPLGAPPPPLPQAAPEFFDFPPSNPPFHGQWGRQGKGQ